MVVVDTGCTQGTGPAGRDTPSLKQENKESKTKNRKIKARCDQRCMSAAVGETDSTVHTAFNPPKPSPPLRRSDAPQFS